MLLDLVTPGLPSLGALAVYVWRAEAAPHSLLAAACLRPLLHVFITAVLLVVAIRVAKDPGAVLQAARVSPAVCLWN
jgi:hypothetical protein